MADDSLEAQETRPLIFVEPLLHEPVIVTDGGPWAAHDCVCMVCRLRSAVLDLNNGIFQPCWSCQQAGWGVRWRRPSRWRRRNHGLPR